MVIGCETRDNRTRTIVISRIPILRRTFILICSELGELGEFGKFGQLEHVPKIGPMSCQFFWHCALGPSGPTPFSREKIGHPLDRPSIRCVDRVMVAVFFPGFVL